MSALLKVKIIFNKDGSMRAGAELKQKYLGGIYPGQELCWAEICIHDELVVVRRFVGGVCIKERSWVLAGDIYSIKEKLRAGYPACKRGGRWSLWAVGASYYWKVYYPSRKWSIAPLRVRWMG